MQDIHDDRRVPLNPADFQITDSLAEAIRRGLADGRRRRNIIDARQSGAADLNAVWHEVEADRIQRQPGLSPDQRHAQLVRIGVQS